MSLSRDELAIVIPARDEATSIHRIAGACVAQARWVIVVDDASSDGTGAALRSLPVQVIRSEVQLGKGGALILGFEHAVALGARAVLTLDGDGQHDPNDTPAFIAAADHYPGCVIMGARLKQVQRAPRRRLLANRIADFWVSWSAGQPIRDTQCGQRLYPIELLHAVRIPTTPATGFTFESELLIEGVLNGFKVVSVPIESRYPPHARASHFRPLRDVWQITCMISRKILLRRLFLSGLVRAVLLKPTVVERGQA